MNTSWLFIMLSISEIVNNLQHCECLRIWRNLLICTSNNIPWPVLLAFASAFYSLLFIIAAVPDPELKSFGALFDTQLLSCLSHLTQLSLFLDPFEHPSSVEVRQDEKKEKYRNRNIKFNVPSIHSLATVYGIV